MGLELDRRTEDSWIVVTVQGEVDIATAPRLREELEAIIVDQGRRVVVDLSSVSFMDSSGLGALVSARKRLEEAGGELVLVSERGQVHRVLGITGLDRVFAVYGDVEEAIGR